MKKILFLLIINFAAAFTMAAKIDPTVVSKVNESLANIKQNIIEFEQYDSRGYATSGTLVISKPNKFRCDYAASYPLLIVGNGKKLYIYDFELEQYSVDEVNHNVFLLLTENDITKVPNIKIKSAYHSENLMAVELEDQETSQKIKITVDANKELKEMDITEANDNNISIIFKQNLAVAGFNDDLFIIKSPLIFGAPKKLTFEEIKAKTR